MFEKEGHTKETLESTSLSEIEPIEEAGLKPNSREDLARMVEAPLLPACQEFYDKNIETTWSSANKKDVGGVAYIVLNYDRLSPENKIVAESFGDKPSEWMNVHYIRIEIPVEKDSTVGDIKQRFLDISAKFYKQKGLKIHW